MILKAPVGLAERDASRRFALGICGGSCSGKTTLIRHLAAQLDRPPSVLCFDAYYRPLEHLSYEERCLVNFDHPDSLEDALFLEHLEDLKAGRGIDEPVYDFARHTRAPEVRRVEPASVLLVDGILLAAFPAVLEELDRLVFVDVPEALRLERRIARDTRERGRSEDSVRRQFEDSVAPMHRLYVQPAANLAHRVIGPKEDLAQVAAEISASLSTR